MDTHTDWVGTRVETVNEMDSIDEFVEYKGKRIRPRASERRHYIMLNKPRGYVTTMQDEKGRALLKKRSRAMGKRHPRRMRKPWRYALRRCMP